MFGIPGLLYVPDYLSPDEHDTLVRALDAQPWRTDLSRRTQQYGYAYEHRKAALNTDDYLGPLPAWLAPLTDRLVADGIYPATPDQCIVNEYEPGQGIGKHTDHVEAFGPMVVSVSLLAPAVLEFKCDEVTVPVALAPRSLLVLRGEARYEWRHGMAARSTDVIDGTVVPRTRRISVTFRTVNKETP
jgi:alkylated DNA repair dioxygenase AlkB